MFGRCGPIFLLSRPFFLHARSGPYFLVDVISVDFFQLWAFFPWNYFPWTFVQNVQIYAFTFLPFMT